MSKKNNQAKKPKKTSEVARRYPLQDLKVLYGESAGLCAYPGCLKRCVKVGPDVIDKVMVGQIGHIESVGEKGARHNPNLTVKQRDCYENWILLCNIHHPILDETDENKKAKYSVETLKNWKKELESFVKRRLQKTMPEVSSSELDVVAKHLLKVKEAQNVDFSLLNPEEKLKKNKLSDSVRDLLKVGLGKSGEVERFVKHISAMHTDFAEELKAGFLAKYKQLWDLDLRGDAIFQELRMYACNHSEDPRLEAAGLAVLAYLFERCEVFEK